MDAQPAKQALCDRPLERGCNLEWLNADIDESSDSAGRIDRVQRRQHEVTRQRRLCRDRCRFLVADFADEDDVGVLTQDRTQRCCKRQAGLLVYLHLYDTRQFVFDRVLDRHDVDAALLDRTEARVERRRLARSRRPGNQDDAFAQVEQEAQALFLAFRHPETVHGEDGGAAVENTDDDLFPSGRRQRRHAQVDARAVHVHPRPTVLRTQPIGDVQFGHDLHARYERDADRARKHHCLTKDAIDAIVDDDDAFLRLEVDVGRTALDAFGDDVVHQLDDRALRRLAGGDVDVFNGRFLEVHIVLAHPFEELLDRHLGTIRLGDLFGDLCRRREVHPDRASRSKSDGALAIEVVRIGGRDVDRGVRRTQREDAILASECLRHRFDRIGFHVIQVGDGHAESRRQCRQNVVVARQPLRDCRFPETFRPFIRQLFELRGVHERLQRREQPIIPCHAIRSSQLEPAWWG